ncbi:hypothetical protein BDN72DRAFT_861105 [Pluteus cervinus]|uniref:Uncharacterized protein n=1 Tax=Pluteus cervinus TaxID=181527 RepID=A0ACD3AGM6_9AGAR|nr:hypothetical protein BDN72DRAFT_861105 [Pluteus cervinus]
MPFFSLPLDVFTYVLSGLDGHSLTKCREYKLKLYRSGMLHNHSRTYSNTPIPQCLHLLNQVNQRRETWSKSWPEQSIHGTQMTNASPYSLWTYQSHVIAYLTINLDVVVLEFLGSQNPTRDLLLHILSLTDGRYHPDATSHSIKLHHVLETNSLIEKVASYDDLMAVHYVNRSVVDEIAIFNWKTGQLITVLLGTHYIFLDSKHILICQRIVTSSSARNEIRVHTIERPQAILIMLFPSFHLNSWHISSGSQTSPDNTPRYPFSSDPALNMITIPLQSRGYHPCRAFLTFPAFVIHDLLANLPNDNLSQSPLEIPWGSWPQCMFIWPTKRTQVYVSGSRIAISHVDATGRKTVIYRFHPEWFKRSMTPRDLAQDNANSGIAPAPVPSGCHAVTTLPLPPPEQVVMTEHGDYLWMDEDLLVTASFSVHPMPVLREHQRRKPVSARSNTLSKTQPYTKNPDLRISEIKPRRIEGDQSQVSWEEHI